MPHQGSEYRDAVVIGGGFYGLYLAEYLARRMRGVRLMEREAALMRRASYVNQARIHNGYHYPRSVLTALRSRVNFSRFVEEFRPAVDSSFDAIYACGRQFSKVTADQFFRSMRRIEARIVPARKPVAALFDSTYVEAVFSVQEHAFSAPVLRELMEERVRSAGVEVQLKANVVAVRPAAGNQVRVEYDTPTGTGTVLAGQVFCCGYAQMNAVGVAGGLAPVPLKHELTELALVEVPEVLCRMGVTVMDGPFFSLMPFPARGLHSLSHVRYTPHFHWHDGGGEYRPAYDIFARAQKQTAFPFMVRDAARYLPAAAACRYKDSLWEVKTILPQSEMDDSRPILFRRNHGLPNYHLVMGGKIDNVYDLTDIIGQSLGLAHGSR